MFRLFNSLFDPAPTSRGRSDSAPIRAAVERVVDRVEPRLRALPHYRRILSGPVERAVDYLAEDLRALPEAVSLERSRFGADPRLRAWFAGPDHLLETLGRSRSVRGYIERLGGAAPAELYAALRMDRTEKKVLGMALEGDRVVRDVPQIAVNFHNHRVGFLSPSEPETRGMVQAHGFDYLVEVARQRIVSIRMRREQLVHQRRRLLQARARASAAGTLDRAGSDGGEDARLRAIEIELGGLAAAIATLGDQLDLIVEILNEPERHLRLGPVSLLLDHMNIRVPDTMRQAAAVVTFNDVLIGGGRRMAIALVRFRREDLPRQPDLLRAVV